MATEFTEDDLNTLIKFRDRLSNPGGVSRYEAVLRDAVTKAVEVLTPLTDTSPLCECGCRQDSHYNRRDFCDICGFDEVSGCPKFRERKSK